MARLTFIIIGTLLMINAIARIHNADINLPHMTMLEKFRQILLTAARVEKIHGSDGGVSLIAYDADGKFLANLRQDGDTKDFTYQEGKTKYHSKVEKERQAATSEEQAAFDDLGKQRAATYKGVSVELAHKSGTYDTGVIGEVNYDLSAGAIGGVYGSKLAGGGYAAIGVTKKLHSRASSSGRTTLDVKADARAMGAVGGGRDFSSGAGLVGAAGYASVGVSASVDHKLFESSGTSASVGVHGRVGAAAMGVATNAGFVGLAGIEVEAGAHGTLSSTTQMTKGCMSSTLSTSSQSVSATAHILNGGLTGGVLAYGSSSAQTESGVFLDTSTVTNRQYGVGLSHKGIHLHTGKPETHSKTGMNSRGQQLVGSAITEGVLAVADCAQADNSTKCTEALANAAVKTAGTAGIMIASTVVENAMSLPGVGQAVAPLTQLALGDAEGAVKAGGKAVVAAGLTSLLGSVPAAQVLLDIGSAAYGLTDPDTSEAPLEARENNEKIRKATAAKVVAGGTCAAAGSLLGPVGTGIGYTLCSQLAMKVR